MMVCRRAAAPIHARAAALLDHLPDEALVVVNDSRVVPARIMGRRVPDGRPFELLVVDPDPALGPGDRLGAWVRQAKKLRPGDRLELGVGEVRAELELEGPDPVDPRARRFRVVQGVVFDCLMAAGEVPLPPYIQRPEGPSDEDRARYQTVYARDPGSVAAPTAGLHLDDAVLSGLAGRIERVTLHVGPGTFLPMEQGDVRAHRVGRERIRLDPGAAARIEAARRAGRPVVAVGTTVVRTLESVAMANGGRICAFEGETDLVITPGHRFRAVDWLLTNFHLPRSSLLMLTATFGGRGRVLEAYVEAVRAGYRFFSFGDCMLLEGEAAPQATGADPDAGRAPGRG